MVAPSGLLRVLRREAAYEERLRVQHDIVQLLNAREGADHRSAAGRDCYGLRLAADVAGVGLHPDDGPWDELSAEVVGELDCVGVGTYVDPDEPWPLRLRAHDGGDDVTADVFLTIDEGDELIEALTHAVRRARERVAALGSPPPDHPPGD